MPESYKIIENRLTITIDVINTRNNTKLVSIAREFDVLQERLWTRLNKHLSILDVRELHNKALQFDQKLALREYIITLNKLHLSAWLHMIQVTTNNLCQLAADLMNSSSFLDLNWLKQ